MARPMPTFVGAGEQDLGQSVGLSVPGNQAFCYTGELGVQGLGLGST